MVSEHRTPVALPHSGGGLAVKNDKKINTSFKVGHMFETHAGPHAHFISGKQSAVSGKAPSPDGRPSHDHDLKSTSRRARKKTIGSCNVLLFFSLKNRQEKANVHLLVNCPKMGMLSSDPSNEFMDTE